ncbi:MAG: hypothetical protein E6J34_23035 [Chloroflexi bacterium]|nr:MAG: hypothetical protein E6J34_23035 [Chloroflexota bacterium]
MEQDVLVDGYNVIKNHLMFQVMEGKNLARARDLLIQQLKNRFRFTDHRVIVVFDGTGAEEQVSHQDHIRIVFSRYGESADSVIIRLASQARLAGRKVEMYSNDGEIKHHVAEQGGTVRTTEQLTRQLNVAPTDLIRRVKHRQAMKSQYGLDPRHKAVDEEPDPAPVREKKRKKKTGRHFK